MSKVAIVTGSNKGIGLAIVRGLCKQFTGDVYITARDVGRGKEAVDLLQKEGLQPKFHQLDVLDKASITTLKDFLVNKYGGLDILVNNAAIAFKFNDPTPFATQAEVTIETNYMARLSVCDALFPILKPGARVVHLSSDAGTKFVSGCPDYRRQQFIAAASIDHITELMTEFVRDAKEDKHIERGWGARAYGVSKAGINAVTSIQQANIDRDQPGSDVIVNACCPGFVQTDMSSHKGNLTPDQGAQTPLYLALLPLGEGKVRGCFVYKKEVYDWRNGQYPVVET